MDGSYIKREHITLGRLQGGGEVLVMPLPKRSQTADPTEKVRNEEADDEEAEDEEDEEEEVDVVKDELLDVETNQKPNEQ